MVSVRTHAVGKHNGPEKTSVAPMLGLGALTDTAILDEILDDRGKAGEGVASFDQVTRFGGAPVSGQRTPMVVVDDCVGSPDATVFEIGLRGEENHGDK